MKVGLLVCSHSLRLTVPCGLVAEGAHPLLLYGVRDGFSRTPARFLAVGTTACLLSGKKNPAILAGSGVFNLVFVKQSAGHRIC